VDPVRRPPPQTSEKEEATKSHHGDESKALGASEDVIYKLDIPANRLVEQQRIAGIAAVTIRATSLPQHLKHLAEQLALYAQPLSHNILSTWQSSRHYTRNLSPTTS